MMARQGNWAGFREKFSVSTTGLSHTLEWSGVLDGEVDANNKTRYLFVKKDPSMSREVADLLPKATAEEPGNDVYSFSRM